MKIKKKIKLLHEDSKYIKVLVDKKIKFVGIWKLN